MSRLLSPAAVLFQVAVTVSPSLKAPPRSEERRVGKECRVRTGACASTEALVLSSVGGLALPAASVAVSETLRLVVPGDDAIMVRVVVGVHALFVATSAAPPPN